MQNQVVFILDKSTLLSLMYPSKSQTFMYICLVHRVKIVLSLSYGVSNYLPGTFEGKKVAPV